MAKKERRGYISRQQILSIDMELDDLPAVHEALEEIIRKTKKLSEDGYELDTEDNNFGARLKIKIVMNQGWD